MKPTNTSFQIGNYIAEQIINHNPYLFDVDGNDKHIGKKIWLMRLVSDKNPVDPVYFKTKAMAKARMTYLAMRFPNGFNISNNN